MNTIAESYVKLVLALGRHDADYVDAFYGPQAWAEEVKASPLPLGAIKEQAETLRSSLLSANVTGEQEIVRLRHRYLVRQLEALSARVMMLQGKQFSFDEEAVALYDVTPPTFDEGHFRGLLNELDSALPGSGPVSGRVESYRLQFVIPRKRLDKVFTAAIGECRTRTMKHIPLPSEERFTVEYVNNKPWSGYNWFKGSACSLIQVNTDLPIFIDRAVDLAAHEGYPGHHVYNTLLEQHLVRERGWWEFSVYALFSPQSLIAEGTANFGIEVAFPAAERIAFEREVLFPLAEMDGSKAAEYYRIQALIGRLSYAGNEAARNYLDRKWSRAQAAEWLVAYALMAPDRADQRIKFFDTYRSYVINYNLGQDLVKRYIESRGGTPDRPAKRWEEFTALISSPRLPSGLA